MFIDMIIDLSTDYDVRNTESFILVVSDYIRRMNANFVHYKYNRILFFVTGHGFRKQFPCLS